MDALLVLLRLALALVFATAAAGKLGDLHGSRAAMRAFGMPARFAGVAGTLLPAAELAVAVALLPAASARWAAVGALALLLSFIGGIARTLARGQAPDCHCFGQLHSAPAGRGALARNAGLAALSGVVVVTGPGPAVGLGPAVGVPAATLGLIWWRLRRDRRAPRPAIPSGLPVGTPAPDFALAVPGSGTRTLEDLRSPGRPVALVFMDPGCGPCRTLVPEIGRWQVTLSQALTIAVISRTAGGNGDLSFGELADVLFQTGSEVSEAYRVPGTPAAVVVSPDGAIASDWAAGAPAIESLIRVTLGRAVR